MKPIADFEIIDHGVDHAQYFQGCGVAYTEYEQVYTGIGDNPFDALEDALDAAAQNGWDVETVRNELSTESGIAFVEDEQGDSQYPDEVYHYVSIRLK